MPPSYINNLFNSIGVSFTDSDNEMTLSVKDYASFFRILYNSSYLTKEHSEEILEFLAKAEYVNGLVAGVPSNITVAHKFGERTFNDSSILGKNIIIGET